MDVILKIVQLQYVSIIILLHIILLLNKRITRLVVFVFINVLVIFLIANVCCEEHNCISLAVLYFSFSLLFPFLLFYFSFSFLFLSLLLNFSTSECGITPMQCQIFNIQLHVIRNMDMFSAFGTNQELSFVMQYHMCTLCIKTCVGTGNIKLIIGMKINVSKGPLRARHKDFMWVLPPSPLGLQKHLSVCFLLDQL